MKIILSSHNEVVAAKKVFSLICELLGSMPSTLEDFIEPENIDEYIIMRHFDEIPMVVLKDEKLLTKQFPGTAEEYE